MDNFDKAIVLPSKPRIVLEEENKGIYEIDGFYPGYGFTIGNSLRRIILSSLPGAAVTSVKVEGVDHEFSSIKGVKEDMIMIMLNIKRLRLKMVTDEAQTISIKGKGVKVITAKDVEVPGQIEVLNPELVIATLTDKDSTFDMEMTVEKGLGFVSRDTLSKNKVNIGVIMVDANFAPIRRASYEVENMRVGDRTDFNRLRIMIEQLKAITGFEEIEESFSSDAIAKAEDEGESLGSSLQKMDPEFLKTRTIGGLARKKEKDILEVEGLGAKGVAEIKRVLGEHGITLK